MSPLEVRCPRCDSPVGTLCVTSEGQVRDHAHRRRTVAAQLATVEPSDGSE
ncbi:zinc finger domain-containing protein [Cellulomonas soli]|uniref:zinc finger domain-containing protein n=1 Tax=Cellulomonas soli TaxID=931535 RepID=UPI003CD0B95D